MIDGKFDVIFRGQIVKSFEVADVQANLIKLFKSSPEAVARLFSGKEVVIRKDLDYQSAMKYQSALKNAGALALIKEVEAAPQEKAVKETVQQVANLAAENADEAMVEDSPEVSPQDASQDLSEISIAEPGAKILPDKVYEQREVDTSEFTLANAGERILPPKEPENIPQPNIDHLSLDDN